MVVKLVNTMVEFNGILAGAGDKAVIVDFYADWCGPCKVIGPKLEAISEEDDFKTTVIFLKVNVDENEEVAEKYEITAMPTFIMIREGEKAGECVGANEGKLRELVKSASQKQQ
ncbi:hypothetical protein ACOMHN_017709 [Nucella lapillus]